MATLKGSNRFNVINTSNNGDSLPLGPGGTTQFSGLMSVQFAPSVDFLGSFTVRAKIMGPAADTAPFVPVAYRRVNVAGAAGDYAIVADPITAAGIVLVPSAGLAIDLLITCTQGSCQIYSMDLQGPSAP